MNFIDDLAEKLELRIKNSSIGKDIKPTILFCGCNTQVKKDMHKLAKRVGLKPYYVIKNPTIKVELKNFRKSKIGGYKAKTININYEDFIYVCKYLERLK